MTVGKRGAVPGEIDRRRSFLVELERPPCPGPSHARAGSIGCDLGRSRKTLRDPDHAQSERRVQLVFVSNQKRLATYGAIAIRGNRHMAERFGLEHEIGIGQGHACSLWSGDRACHALPAKRFLNLPIRRRITRGIPRVRMERDCVNDVRIGGGDIGEECIRLWIQRIILRELNIETDRARPRLLERGGEQGVLVARQRP